MAAILPTPQRDSVYGSWEEITTWLTAPFSIHSQYILTHKDDISKAFEYVFGRKPTFKEIETIAYSYLRNKQKYGDVLKDRKFVLNLQRTINRYISPKIKEDGTFYYQTVCGIMKYQQLKGITPTGFLDKATLLELAKDSNSQKFREIVDKQMGDNKIKYIFLIGGLALAAVVMMKMIERR